MYVGNDFPNMSPTETRRITLDFVNDLDPNLPETIISAQWFCEVPADLNTLTDPSPQSHVSGAVTISGSRVIQLITGLLPGITYRMRCVATTSASAAPELYSHLRCVAND